MHAQRSRSTPSVMHDGKFPCSQAPYLPVEKLIYHRKLSMGGNAFPDVRY